MRDPKLKTQQELQRNWKKNAPPLVSICCITYNQEDYIEKCLQGFLMQETDFPFEILVHDDASTDRTADIIREYENEYPAFFRCIYQTENQYSKRKGGGMNAQFNYPRTKGEFIAICEGDDYWTDPLKLQRQVDFLENNLEYSAVTENSRIINQKAEEIRLFSEVETPINYGVKDFILGRKFHMVSILFRKKDLNLPENFKEFPFGDTLLFVSLAQKKPIRFFPRVSSVYRKHEGGVTMMKDRRKWIHKAEIFHLLLNVFLEKEYSLIHYKTIKGFYFNLLRESWEKRDVSNFLYSIKKILYYKNKIRSISKKS